MTSLLVCLAAIIVLVIAVCAAVRFCDLDHVNLKANVLKLADVSFSVKSREMPKNTIGKPPSRKKAHR